MANNRDTILLETVKTHRARLLAAFLYGELSERRVVNDNVKRLLGSIVLAAVVCTGCVGFALVTSLLANQAAARKAQESKGPVAPGISDQAYAADYFDRISKRGWGSAELGGRWRTSGATADFTVRKGVGRLDVPPGDTRMALLAVDRETADVATTVSMDELGSAVTVVGRKVGSDDYRLRLALTQGRQLVAGLSSRQEGETVPLSNTAGLVGEYGAGDEVKVRLQVYGINPTTLRAKVWRVGEQEPTGWTVTAQDTFEPLQRGGAVGVGASRPEDAQRAVRVEVAEFVARPVFG